MTAPLEGQTAPVDGNTAPAATPTPASMPQFLPPAHAAAEPNGQGEDDGDDGSDDGQQSKTTAEIARFKRAEQKLRAQRRESDEKAEQLRQALEAATAKQAESEERWGKLAAFFNPDANTPPDPEQLTKQLAEEQAKASKLAADHTAALEAARAENRELRILAALPGVLDKAKAHPDLTPKILRADGALAKLDPTSDTFNDDLVSAVNTALEQNPYLKVSDSPKLPARSGAEIPGRSGGSNQLTREQLAGMTSEQIVEAMSKGLTRNLAHGG